MTTSLWNAWRKPKARRAARRQASGSSPFTWKTGAWTILATSVGYTDDRADSGAVVNPNWLLTTTWMVPPGAVAGQLRQLEGLGHHALAGEGGVAVDEDRQHVEAPVVGPSMSCLARTMPSTTGSTASRCDGFDANVTGSSAPERPTNLPVAPLWYFTSPEPCTESGSRSPSNSRKISP